MEKALYYPFIHPRDPNWLRRAVLFWDELERIVPSEHADAPSSWPEQGIEEALLMERGFLTSTMPTDSELFGLGRVWRTLIDENADALRRRYGIDVPPTAPVSGFVGGNDGFARFWPAKASYEVVDALLHHGLAHSDGVPWSNGNALAVHPRLLGAYMTSLALACIADRPIDTVTDTPGHALMFRSSDADVLRQTLLGDTGSIPARAVTEDDVDTVLMLALEAAVPEGLGRLPMGEVLDIRNRSATSQAAFKAQARKAVAELADRRAKARNHLLAPSDVEAVRKLYIDQPLEEVRQSYRDAGLGFVGTVLTVSAVAPAGIVGAALAVLAPPAVPIAAVGAALSVYGAWRSARAGAAQARAASPVGWLVDVHQHVDATRALQWGGRL